MCAAHNTRLCDPGRVRTYVGTHLRKPPPRRPPLRLLISRPLIGLLVVALLAALTALAAVHHLGQPRPRTLGARAHPPPATTGTPAEPAWSAPFQNPVSPSRVLAHAPAPTARAAAPQSESRSTAPAPAPGPQENPAPASSRSRFQPPPPLAPQTSQPGPPSSPAPSPAPALGQAAPVQGHQGDSHQDAGPPACKDLLSLLLGC